MPKVSFLSIAEQVAEHLRGEIFRGRWSESIPGIHQLANELEVNSKTVEVALRQLESEGLLVPQGAGRKRRIVLPSGRKALRQLRVAILLHEEPDQGVGYMIELQHALAAAGHSAFYPPKALIELGMDVKRIANLVKRTEADAWVVCAGSREVLGWFSAQETPSFALFGRRAGVPIASAGPDKPLALAAATRQLIGLGHRRIALLCRKMRRLPEPGRSERVFLEELEAHDIPTSDFNLPDWEESKDGFQALLDSLFRVTPPTALILDEAPIFAAAQQFLARQGVQVPEKVSLVSTDADPTFAWCEPSIAHIRWDTGPVVRRIMRWAANMSRGHPDVRQYFVPAEYIAGGTVGPAPTD
ncbi:MAG: substrate-binding domain-containing protein [Roseibacillus sp.]